MSAVTYLEAIGQAIREEMQRDEAVFLLGEDVGTYGGAFKVSAGLLEEFGPDRVIDTPMAEAAIIGSAVGAALMGMRPIAEMQFIDFITCGFDQIINMASKMYWRVGMPVPMVIRGPSGGGTKGGPFHSASPEAWFFHTPGIKVVVPATTYDAKGMLKAAIRDNNPVLYLEHKLLYRMAELREELPNEDYVVPLGNAITRREGEDMIFFFQAEDGIRDYKVTGVQTCALPIFSSRFEVNYSASTLTARADCKGSNCGLICNARCR